jgi:hypothetical protein
LYAAEAARRVVIGVVVSLGRKRDDARKREKEKNIYICKKNLHSVLFCSTNWLAAERPQYYTMQCECKDFIIIIEDGIKKRGKGKSCVEE